MLFSRNRRGVGAGVYLGLGLGLARGAERGGWSGSGRVVAWLAAAAINQFDQAGNAEFSGVVFPTAMPPFPELSAAE